MFHFVMENYTYTWHHYSSCSHYFADLVFLTVNVLSSQILNWLVPIQNRMKTERSKYIVVTARIDSCGKVMFQLCLSICPQGRVPVPLHHGIRLFPPPPPQKD